MKWIYSQVAPLRGQMDSGVDHREGLELPSLAADELSPHEFREHVPALHTESGRDNHKIKKACASLAQRRVTSDGRDCLSARGQICSQEVMASFYVMWHS